ncbi:hypothetical protein DYB28_008159 [Aphanomyces astaci]|uniref:Uncharacterized protein n=1 Tax=Aphanomyces astaci TaxID=112090 RepID=A0A9X8E628_APHAT|nr:hypothetical protein DYB28_008159 [Aphanomyces astaci]
MLRTTAALITTTTTTTTPAKHAQDTTQPPPSSHDDEGTNDEQVDDEGGGKSSDDDTDRNPRPNKKAKTAESSSLLAKLEVLQKEVGDAVAMNAVQFDTLSEHLVAMDARITAVAARAYNLPLSHEWCLDSEFQPVPKAIPGHPARYSPPEGLDEKTVFDVGDVPPPPVHDLIATVRSVDGINHHDQLDAIHWFYNDPRLAHHSGSTISQRRIALRSFLCR